jgi:hypothetical protein
MCNVAHPTQRFRPKKLRIGTTTSRRAPRIRACGLRVAKGRAPPTPCVHSWLTAHLRRRPPWRASDSATSINPCNATSTSAQLLAARSWRVCDVDHNLLLFFLQSPRQIAMGRVGSGASEGARRRRARVARTSARLGARTSGASPLASLQALICFDVSIALIGNERGCLQRHCCATHYEVRLRYSSYPSQVRE